VGPARLTLAALLCCIPACRAAPGSLILGASSSVSDSGLLDSLVAGYRRAHPGARVRTVVAGSGPLLDLARRGSADVLLVQAPEAEERYLRETPAAERIPFMYNEYLLVGPADDPAGIAGLRDPLRALDRIERTQARFVSRGVGSGTHEREAALWREAGIEPRGDWYMEADEDQAVTLRLAGRRRAYTLTDRATFARLEPELALEPLVRGQVSLLNLYSVIVPGGSGRAAAVEFARWLTSLPGRRTIAGFGQDHAGFPLFAPVLVGRSLPFPVGMEEDSSAEDSTSSGVTGPAP